jgi:hypothetical protein
MLGFKRLEHRRDLAHLGRGHMAEDVAVPMHNAALLGGIGEVTPQRFRIAPCRRPR